MKFTKKSLIETLRDLNDGKTSYQAIKNKMGFELVNNEPWIEIDFLGDYEKAKNKIYPKLRN